LGAAAVVRSTETSRCPASRHQGARLERVHADWNHRPTCHCEERSDEAIPCGRGDCFVAPLLAMTGCDTTGGVSGQRKRALAGGGRLERRAGVEGQGAWHVVEVAHLAAHAVALGA